MYKLKLIYLSISLFILTGIVLNGSAKAGVVTCTGGEGNDYGGMTCYAPLCTVTSNPAVGCLDDGSTPVDPPPNQPDGALRCYPTSSNYQELYCNVVNDTYTCYSLISGSIATDMNAFCAIPPTGYTNPSTNVIPSTIGGQTYSCYELGEQFLEAYCRNFQ